MTSVLQSSDDSAIDIVFMPASTIVGGEYYVLGSSVRPAVDTYSA